MPVTLTPALVPKETGGSPEFPGYPCEHMPRSQTPVVSRSLALTRTGLLPSGSSIPSAFEPVARLYSWSTTIHFSEFNDAACLLALPLLRTLPFSSRSSVRLPTWWLAFGRVGLESSSHPLGNVDMFQEVSPPFPRPEFISARGAAWFGQCQCWVDWIGNESRRRLSVLNQLEQEGAEQAEDDGANCVRESHPSAFSAISCSNLGIMLAEQYD